MESQVADDADKPPLDQTRNVLNIYNILKASRKPQVIHYDFINRLTLLFSKLGRVFFSTQSIAAGNTRKTILKTTHE